MELISDKLKNEIWVQIAHEKYNSQLYLYISAFLKNKGLDNLATIFEKQYTEEESHALEFIKLLTDLSIDVKMLEIEEITVPFNTISEIAKFYLETEISTTTGMGVIKKLAIEEENYVVEERIRQMLLKQQHEYEEATRFLDNALLCEGEDSWWKTKVWNDSI